MTEPMSDTVRITLKGLPDEVPMNQRVKRLLKWALRGLNLRCVSIDGGEVKSEESDLVDAPTSMYGGGNMP